MHFLRVRILLYCMVCLLTCSASLLAQEFRIETDLYLGESSKPVGHNVTLFDNGMVYDFQVGVDAPDEIIEISIFDRTKQQFVLLDLKRKVRLELERSQLIQMLEGLRNEMMQQDETRYLADVEFEEEHDLSTDEVTLTTDSIRYKILGTQPRDTMVLPVYHDFLDHYTMLAASDPRRFPPFARLKCNSIIKKYGWLPTRIEFLFSGGPKTNRQLEARTEHTNQFQLSKRDRDRIETARRNWTSFQRVSLREYRQLAVAAADRSDKTRKSR